MTAYSIDFSDKFKMTHFRGARNDEEQIYTYDEMGGLTSYREMNPNYGKDILYTVKYERDNQKLIITQTPKQKHSDAHFSKLIYYYDETDLIYKVEYFLCASDVIDTTKQTTTYQYDKKKRIIRTTLTKYATNTDIMYEYNESGLLSKEKHLSSNYSVEYEDIIRDSLSYKIIICKK